MGKRIVAASLLALGTLAMGVAVATWGACWVSPMSDACFAASDANAGMTTATTFWVVAALICGAGLFVRSARVGSAISIAVLLLVNPLTDPGFVWAFDSADSTPGRGIIGAGALLTAGLIVALSRRAPVETQHAPRVTQAA